MKAKFLISTLLIFSIVISCKPTNEKDKIDNPPSKEQSVKSYLYGIDISHHQNNEIDSIFKSTDSLSFVICKATEGVTYTDPKFIQNWRTIKDKGFIRGAYHFYRCQDSPVEQANLFIKTISDIDTIDLPPIIDFEEGGIDESQTVEEIQSSLKTFINVIEKQLQSTPIIYTDVNTGNKYLNDLYFSKYPLWIANYTEKNEPDLPVTWKSKNWVFWQKNITYKLESQNNDFDIYNGDLVELKDFIKNSYHR